MKPYQVVIKTGIGELDKEIKYKEREKSLKKKIDRICSLYPITKNLQSISYNECKATRQRT